VSGGSGAVARLSCITFDCLDEEVVASFWENLLGLGSRHRIGPYVFLTDPNGVGFGFQRVAAVTTGKIRVHLDIHADPLDAVIERALELGGSFARGYEDGGFLVMADPEGNEFCLLPGGEWRLDDDGIAHYPGSTAH